MMTLEAATRRTTIVTDMSFFNEDMSEYLLHEVQFHQCRFTDCNFDESQISGSRFTHCRFVDCSFRSAVFTTCSFYDSENGLGSQWIRCDHSETKFVDCDLALSIFSKGSAYLLTLTDCNAAEMKLDCTVHRKIAHRVLKGGLVFSNCRMPSAEFAPGDYENSRFEACDMRECVLSGSQLSHTNFCGSNLNNADLTNATLDGAILSHASIEGFDLSSLQSFNSIIVSRDQHEQLLECLGIHTQN